MTHAIRLEAYVFYDDDDYYDERYTFVRLLDG